MIRLNQITNASFDIRRKAKQVSAREVENAVYIIPHDEKKDRRAVIFLPDGIICVSTDGVACPANDFGNVCYHVLAAARRREINRKRRETLRRKKAA